MAIAFCGGLSFALGMCLFFVPRVYLFMDEKVFRKQRKDPVLTSGMQTDSSALIH